MRTSKKNSKDSLKILYNESKKRIKLIIISVAKLHKEKEFSEHIDEQTCNALSQLCSQIYESSKIEDPNQYSEAIGKISYKMGSILQNNFHTNSKNIYPHPIFVVKKGAEILHSFLYRDLRRKQFSSEENEIYQNYLALVRKLPAPNTHEKIL